MKYLGTKYQFQQSISFRRHSLFGLIQGILALSLLIADPLLAQNNSISPDNFKYKNNTDSEKLVADRSTSAQKKIVKVGVLAIREMDHTKQKWQATIDYLNQEIPEYKFQMVPFRLDDVDQLIKNNVIDFGLVNPGLYVALESLYDARYIATLNNLRLGNASTHFGAVIIRRSDRQDIQNLQDLKGKTLWQLVRWPLEVGKWLGQLF